MTTLSALPASVTNAAPAETLADLMVRLGNVPAHRVRLRPPPGTAVEQDVLDAQKNGRLCELVDGVLVEKAMGYTESILAAFLIEMLNAFVRPRNLGFVSAPDGTVRLFPGLVRIPDVAFASWDRLPDRRRPTAPIPQIAPDLAVEVLSQGNTVEEMERKRGEYFTAGVRLVWLVDPAARTVEVFTSASASTRHTETDTLDGGAVLPGFRLPLRELFGEMDRQG